VYNTIFVVLGERCNFKCKYCLQVDNVNQSINVGTIHERVYTFIAEQARANVEAGSLLYIQPWGGEPLLYWDLIVDMVTRLEADGIEFAFGIVTNGSLLTEAKVSFINEHGIHVSVSHDGPTNLQSRGTDVFSDTHIFKMFSGIKSKSVAAVMSAYNPDYYSIWDYFDELFKDDSNVQDAGGITVCVDLIKETWDMPSELTAFDTKAYEAMIDKVTNEAYELYIKGAKRSHAFWLINGYVQRIQAFVDQNATNDFLTYAKCGAAKRMANIDLEGNFYACHNSSIKIGTVEDSPEQLLENFAPHNEYILSDKCQNCDVNFICSGGCFLIKGDAARERHCTLRKIFYGKIIDMLLKLNA